MKKIYITIIALLVINFVQGQDFYFDLNKSYENKVSIYNNADKKVGYISVSSLRINYYDVNDKLVKSEKSNNTITIKNFMEVTKKGTIEITENRLKAGIRKWNVVSDSFDIFDNNDEKIGVYFFEGNGVWKYKEEAIYKNRSSYSVKFGEEKEGSKNISAVTYNDFTRNNTNNNNTNSTSSNQTEFSSTNSSSAKSKKRLRKVNKSRIYGGKTSFILPRAEGVLYLGGSLYENNLESIPNNIFEIGYFDYNRNYFGFQYGSQKSNTNSGYDDLNDQIYALSYGRGILGTRCRSCGSTLYLKFDVGYHTYNYATIESFGDFYDIGEGVYGNVGLRLIVFDFAGINIIGDYNINSKGLTSYGFGIGISL